jgi:quercetin dioxygenase-like cupin family protein
MSTITSILTALKTASHPVARALHKGEDFKVLAIGFRRGMILADHKAHIPSKLTVLYGSVEYKETDKVVTLSQYEEVGIPVEITHSVEALEDSLCLLTQGGFSN